MAVPISTSFDAQEKEIAITHILSQVSAGRSVAQILRDDKDFVDLPSACTFWIWHLRDEALQSDLARARSNGVEAHMEEIIDIADTSNADAYVDYAKDGTPIARIDGEALRRSALRIQTRTQRAAMLLPRKYGAKLDMTSNGETVGAASLTEAQRAARAGALLQTAKARIVEHRPAKRSLDDLLS